MYANDGRSSAEPDATPLENPGINGHVTYENNLRLGSLAYEYL